LNQSRSLTPVLGVFLSVGLVIGLIWGIYHFSENEISGEGFSIQWISIRSLVTDGISPYSDLVTGRIQDTIPYENSFAEGNPPRYTSPLYSAIIVIPFALIENYTLAHTLWLAAQLVAIFAIILIALKLTSWRPAWFAFLVFTLLSIFSYHVIIPWLDGGLSLWASLFMILAFLMIRNNWLEIGGIFLALAAIQPQMVILVLIFVLLWAMSHRKRLVVLWFFITLIFLSIVGLFLVPDWIMQYLRIIFNIRNFPPGSPGYYFEICPRFRQAARLVAHRVVGDHTSCKVVGGEAPEFRWFIWTACLTIVISQWIRNSNNTRKFRCHALPLVLISSLLTERWSREGSGWA
jgi:hypothetical protein